MNSSPETESAKQLTDKETPWYRKRAVLIGAGSLVTVAAVIGAVALGALPIEMKASQLPKHLLTRQHLRKPNRP